VDSASIVAALKPALRAVAPKLAVSADKPDLYALVGRKPSPFPQHKGSPLEFGSIRVGKSYVSFHLMPLYTSTTLLAAVTPQLKKRMQGKSCFNFTAVPDADLVADLTELVTKAAAAWTKQGWL
jgi:hypothetical protein